SLRMLAKDCLQYLIVDIGLTITTVVKPDVALIKFNSVYRNSRCKPAHDAFYRMHRYCPYTEEAEYVINTESVEIITHLTKPLAPPCKPIFLHFLPIVCGEAPVLSLHGKVVWRCAGLHIHIV